MKKTFLVLSISCEEGCVVAFKQRQLTYSSYAQHLPQDGCQSFIGRPQALALGRKVIMVMQDQLISKVGKLITTQSSHWAGSHSQNDLTSYSFH